MDNNWCDWTACEMYGHKFVEGVCTDCSERLEENNEKKKMINLLEVAQSVDLVTIAQVIAREAHKGQKRWDGLEYITHPESVVRLVDTDDLKVIAWLHDILEDTNVAPEYLRIYFPFHIVESIIVLTRKKDENYKDFILRCAKDSNARLVKIADLKHNLSNLKEGSMKDKYRLALYILEEYENEI